MSTFSISARRLMESRMIWIIPSPNLSRRQEIMWRSDSVNRTVVDLSLSFLMAVSFYKPIECVSLPRSNEGKLGGAADRYRTDVATVSLSNDFYRSFSAANGNDVEISLSGESAPPPLKARFPLKRSGPALRRQDRNLVKSGLSCLRRILVNRRVQKFETAV